MALPAGRKGVLPSELTPDGRIKNNGSQYVLPVATNTTLGGVKPVAKTETMTKEVGVDSEGKLFVEPSQGGGVEIGSATLASGLTGYINYIKCGALCIITGVVTGLSAAVYTGADLCTGLPYVGAGSYTFPLLIKANDTNVYVANLFMSPAKAVAYARNKALSNSVKYTICGMYLCEEVEGLALTLQNCTSESWGYVGKSGDYAFVCGNFEATGYTANTPIDLSVGLPKIDKMLLNSLISDGTKSTNTNDLYVENTTLKAVMPSTSNARMDGAFIYKIDKGE